MFWTPKGKHLGDPTIICVGATYHLFAECRPLSWSGGTGESFAGITTVCHAVSEDLRHWRELPVALECGAPGAFDAYSIYHMDVFLHEGRWYMFYTGLDKGGPGEQQSIGLATSGDGLTWTKHAANPILRADPRWYEQAIPREATYQEKDFGRLWFRDPCVVRLPDGRFGMIVTARDIRQHPDVRACLAWAVSDDLLHWEPRPPIYSPGRFHTIETPSIFEHDGRWYIQFMTAPHWGTPLLMTDPYQDAGDFYAVSTDGPEGPYHQPADEVLVAAHHHVRLGASRMVAGPDGTHWFYGWLRLATPGSPETLETGAWQVLPLSRPVRFQPDGTPWIGFNPAGEQFYQPARPWTPATTMPVSAWQGGDPIRGKSFAVPAYALGAGAGNDLIFSTTIEFRRGARAGCLLRYDPAAGRGLQILADRRRGRIELGVAGEPLFIDARQWMPRERFNLKVVAWQANIEVYVDDRLMIQQACPAGLSGTAGLLVEEAEAVFYEPRLLDAKIDKGSPEARHEP